MNRIILYVGMVYNFFCAGITANLIADSHKLGTFGKYLLIFSLMISIWYIILILMKMQTNVISSLERLLTLMQPKKAVTSRWTMQSQSN